jgi:hypothetical protein
MTHTQHYSTLTTEEWLESPQAKTDLLDWLAGYAPDSIIDSVRINIIGWAPLPVIANNETVREWLHEINILHPVADMLYGRYIEDWLDSPHEHRAFHSQADRAGRDVLCSGCWS